MEILITVTSKRKFSSICIHRYPRSFAMSHKVTSDHQQHSKMKILAYRCGLPKNDRLGTREMGNRLIIDLAGKNAGIFLQSHIR